MDTGYNEIFNNITYSGITPGWAIVLVAIAIWSLIWKGIALWKAARNGSKRWFTAILVLNTAGILEIIYIFLFSNRQNNDQKTNLS